MAPSTPPPPASDVLAALTMASTASVVMSATQISSRVVPTCALSNGAATAAMTLACPLGLCLGREIDRAAHAEIVEMLAQEILPGALAAVAQQLEKSEIGVELRGGRQLLEGAVERNAMHIDAPVFARARAARQPALIDQAGHEID